MKKININVNVQRDDECLSECLLAVFKYYNLNITLDDIISYVSTDSDKLYDWEFKAGSLALKNNLKPIIHTNVSYLFDPSWNGLDNDKLLAKLKEEARFFSEKLELVNKEPEQKNYIFPNKLIADRYKKEVDAAVEYVENGGRISFSAISANLIKEYLNKGVPLIVSLNPTLLHRMKRAYNFEPDDIRGIVWGHVVVIKGYENDNFIVADPGGDFYVGEFEYSMNMDGVIESILRYNGQLIAIAK